MAWSPPASTWSPPSGSPGCPPCPPCPPGGVTNLDTIDFTTDMTTLTVTTIGTHTLYKADGTTPKATLVVAVSGTPGPAAGWSIACNAASSPPILLSGVQWPGSGSGVYVTVQVEPAFASEPNWTRDRWFAQVLYSGISTSGTSAADFDGVRMGMAPKGSGIVDPDSCDISASDLGGPGAVWKRESWTTVDIVTLAYTTAINASQLLLCDYLRLRLALKQGGTAFVSDYGTGGGWDMDTVGAGAVPSSGDPNVGPYSPGWGAMVLAFNKTNAGTTAIGLSQILLSVGAPAEP